MAQADPGYENRLLGLGSEALVKAMRSGDWGIIEGAFFDWWNKARNVVRPFEVPKTWMRFRSMDWGSAKPFSVGWWAVASDQHEATNTAGDKLLIPRGCMVRYREWYGSQNHNNTGLKLDAETVAKGIVDREWKEPTDRDGKNKIMYRVLDPSAFKVDGGPSIAERMFRTHQLLFRPADNARIAKKGALSGWDAVRSRLVGREGIPMIYFMEHCVDAIRTLPALQHDPDNIQAQLAIGVKYGRLHFYKGFGLDYERPEIDKSIAMADFMHRNGMLVSLYVAGTMFIESFYREVPQAVDWEQRDQNNRPVYYSDTQTYRHFACPNEPLYREYIKKVLRIGVERPRRG